MVLRLTVIATITLLVLITTAIMVITGHDADKGFGKAMLSFRFDDGYASQTKAYEILRERNMTAIFFCVADMVGTQDYMDWNQLVKMQADGFEIGSHSMTHRNMLFLRKAEYENELVLSKEEFEARDITVSSFAYPYGTKNPFMRKALKDNYGCAAGYPAFAGSLNSRETDRYALSCRADVRSAEDFEANLKKAIDEKAWMVACFHRVGDPEGRYFVNEEEFGKIADIAKDYSDRGLIMVTGFSEACSSLG
ncbi:MAG: polysaccharide deacetylase family protein [archaeon]